MHAAVDPGHLHVGQELIGRLVWMHDRALIDIRRFRPFFRCGSRFRSRSSSPAWSNFIPDSSASAAVFRDSSQAR